MPRDPRFPDVFEPDESHPLIDDFALRAQRHRARQQPAGIPPVNPIPLRNHSMWSNNNELGIDVGYQPDGNGFQTILKMDEWDFPALWTVALGIQYTAADIPGGGDGAFSIDGLIRFGAGGATQEAEVDWSNGTIFSVPMNALNVIARYSDFSGKNNTPPDLRLRVTLCKGGDARSNATRSFRTSVPTVDNAYVEIPRFARRVSVSNGFGSATSSAWTSTYTYSFRGRPTIGGDLGGFNGQEYFDGGFGPEGISIPPAARFLRINNTGLTTELIWTTFHLAF